MAARMILVPVAAHRTTRSLSIQRAEPVDPRAKASSAIRMPRKPRQGQAPVAHGAPRMPESVRAAVTTKAESACPRPLARQPFLSRHTKVALQRATSATKMKRTQKPAKARVALGALTTRIIRVRLAAATRKRACVQWRHRRSIKLPASLRQTCRLARHGATALLAATQSTSTARMDAASSVALPPTPRARQGHRKRGAAAVGRSGRVADRCRGM